MNYGKNGLKEQIRSTTSKANKRKTKAAVITFKVILTGFFCVCVMLLAAGVGMFRGILNSAPDLSTLDVSPNASATILYDADGNEIQTLVMAGSNRQPVEISQVPKNLINAFVAIEDERFWTHKGIDIKGVARAAVSGLLSGEFDQGASTITQQLIKNAVFNGGAEKTFGTKFKRKLQEQYLAIQLERIMDKDIILQNYLNTINLGANTLGVEAASERYFAKSVSDLNLSECAVIAAITQNPTRYNPITNPEENAKRRDIVLEDMYNQGYISEEELREAKDEEVYKLIQEVDAARSNESSVYSYFVDETIVQALADLQEKAGYSETEARNLLYSGGLEIYTTQDPELQKIVDEEISDPANYSSAIQYGFTYRLSVEAEDGTVTHYSEGNLKSWLRDRNGAAVKLIFDTKEEIEQIVNEYRGTVIGPSDTVQGERLDITLQPQGSVVLMDQESGYVRAISGGRGEKTMSLSLNRATDTLRQPGSTFKVLTAFAPALDSAGSTLGTVYYDAPYTLDNKTFSNWWQNGYVGYSNIRDGITYSMNIVALKTMMNTISPQVGYQYALDFGITSLVDSETDPDTGKVFTDIGPTLCLGGITHGVSNLELTAAYAAIANKGVYTKPVYYTKILDQNGRILVDNTPDTHTVIKESTAWLLTNAMEDVCDLSYLFGRTDIRSSAPQATVAGLPSAGKSGTTTANNDVWFVGYTPYYTMGIWQGYDENSYMSTGEDVKNMWHKIMSRACEGLPTKEFPAMPDNIEEVTICHKSGKLAIPGTCDHDPQSDMTYKEYFAKGTAPTEVCDHHVKVTICRFSGSLATEFCPDAAKESRVYRLITDEITGATDDSRYQLPDALKNSTCHIHTSNPFPFLPGDPGELETPAESGSVPSGSDTAPTAPGESATDTPGDPTPTAPSTPNTPGNLIPTIPNSVAPPVPPG